MNQSKAKSIFFIFSCLVFWTKHRECSLPWRFTTFGELSLLTPLLSVFLINYSPNSVSIWLFPMLTAHLIFRISFSILMWLQWDTKKLHKTNGFTYLKYYLIMIPLQQNPSTSSSQRGNSQWLLVCGGQVITFLLPISEKVREQWGQEQNVLIKY